MSSLASRRPAFSPTPPTNGNNGAAHFPAPEPPDAAQRSSLGNSTATSLILGVYGVFLFAFIVGYFSLLIFLAMLALDVAGWFFRQLAPPTGLWGLGALGLPIVLFCLTRLTLHVWRGIIGLVTQRYDTAADPTDTLLLPADKYPDLYAVVAEVGNLVMSPMPDEIRLTHEATCYAVELRQLALQTDRKLVLVIGLPQLEVLTDAELKVIVAHELAHFGGGDTRLGVFVYRFLETLRRAQEETAQQLWRWIDPVAWLSWACFHVFLILSAPIRKHQEFRADSWSAAAFGGEFAARTLLKDWLLARQFQESLARFSHTIPRNTPTGPQNVFREFAAAFHDLTPEGHDYLERRLAEEEQPSFWDSHPTTRERMRQMRRYPNQTLSEPLPCHFLLPDFEWLERKVQEDFRRTGRV